MNEYKVCCICHFEILENAHVWWKGRWYHIICFFHHLYFEMDKQKAPATLIPKEVADG
jgi:hypothetical protein